MRGALSFLLVSLLIDQAGILSVRLTVDRKG
jgi:hypothetical protein